ncbi:hypothetical protein SCLCIDRAFT_1214958 [Scleroderma citrinum Foug A]|uniref:Uncharacterized protein n=1 Tax=Scleroderma citrinum Foug A TaxID=1036808 RepID=A0A0C3E3P2_9AGAM|nr:hypothetical protein SCLCIDRAFT_1214958 [Scleroderma citrinum Foug A]
MLCVVLGLQQSSLLFLFPRDAYRPYTYDPTNGNSSAASSQAREPDVSAACHIGHEVSATLL